MSRRVFHTLGPLSPGTTVALSPDEARYLLRVRRAAVGDAVEVLDGRGGHVQAQITSADGRRCEVRLGASIPAPALAQVVLLLGLPEPRATLDAITLATEVGATTIVLVKCRRSQAAVPSPDRIARTIQAAQRQCGRAVPPEIVGPIELSAALLRDDPRPGWVAHPAASPEARSDLGAPPATEPSAEPTGGATILVGPEGGLVPQEVQAARAAGLRPLSLGPFILRTETAALAALVRAVGMAARPPC